MPTSRNAKGVDILLFSQNVSRKFSIQVKTLSKKNSVPLGANLDSFVADYVGVCVRNYPKEPICYVLTSNDVKKLACKREKNGKHSYWLQRPEYEKDEYMENWEIIGHGVP